MNRSTWKNPSSLTTRLAAIVIRLTVRVLSAILSNSSVVAEIRILPRLVGVRFHGWHTPDRAGRDLRGCRVESAPSDGRGEAYGTQPQ